MTKLDETVKNLLKRTDNQPVIISYICKSQIHENQDIIDYINFSNIFTTLIQETGRFTERYASDLLISIESFKRDLTQILYSKPTVPVTCNEYFGIRQNGVDGETFLNIRLTEAAEHHNYFQFQNTYRRIYAIHVNIVPDTNSYDISVHFLNLTNDCDMKIFATKEES